MCLFWRSVAPLNTLQIPSVYYPFSEKPYIESRNIGYNTTDYPCLICQEKFSTRKAVKEHVKKHHGLGYVIKCSQCNHESKTKSALSNHVNSVHKDKGIFKYKCSLCLFKTNSKQSFSTHSKAVHKDTSIKQDTFDCKLCPYETFYSSSLKYHLDSSHELAKLIECDKCKYRTRSMAKLKLHKKKVHK